MVSSIGSSLIAYPGCGAIRKERAEAIDTLSKARISVALVKGSDLDLTSAAGRMYAGVLGEFDTAESEIKAERVARAARQAPRKAGPMGLAPMGGSALTSVMGRAASSGGRTRSTNPLPRS